MKVNRRARAGLAFTLVTVALTATPASAVDRHAPSRGQNWAELSSLLAQADDAYTAPPALNTVESTGYTAGLLLGNGDLAVTSDARDHAQTYYVAKSDFWHASNGQGQFGRISISSPTDAKASATAKDTLECTASCVIDGNPETRWVSKSNASADDPQWVTVDLGTARTVDRWVVRHNGHQGRADNYQKLNTRGFTLQKSDNGTDWSDIDTVTGNTAELTDRTVPAFTARYVRLRIAGAVRDPADPNQKAYLRDLQLFHGSTDVLAGSGDDPAYRQFQDIAKAEVRGTQTVGGKVLHTRSWLADGENLLVTEVRTDEDAGVVPIRIDLSAPNGTAGTSGDGQVWVNRATGTDTATGWVSKAAASTKVLGAEGQVTAGTPTANTARLAFDLTPGRTVRLVTSVHGNGTYSNTTALQTVTDRAVERAATVDRAGIERAHRNHLDRWRTFWLKSYLDTGDKTLNKFYYGGLYAVAAANHAGFLPGGTYSPWRTAESANLGNRYFLNYNTESQYYGVYSANRPELAQPYYRVIEAEVPWQRNRTRAAGYRGLSFQRSISPFNTTRPAPAEDPIAPVKNYQKLPSDQQTNATFAVLPFLMDYEYTGDIEFFRETTYPLLKELGAFWLDFIEKDAATGKYVIRHSAVNEGGDDVNSVYDLGYLRRVLTALIDGSKTLGVDAEMRPRWQEVLDNLTPYPTGVRDGLDVILLASEINNPIKGNDLLNKNDQPINLEGVVHPSDNLAIGGDPELLRLARNTLEWVDPFRPGSRGSSGNGFPKTFTIAARVGWDPEDLIAKFRTVIGNLWRPNHTVRQFGGAQETSGAIETINSMMLQTYQGTTRVFPSWPAERDAKFVRLRAKGAFLLSAEQKSGMVRHIDVTSDKGDRFTLVSPWGEQRVRVVDERGRTVRYQADGDKVSFPTTAGTTYRITASNHGRR
ncbi:discoidin domain-containing protein [Streptomyces sp. F001]|uniref:glycosyl hydrolase family 95 catalytic domain-containing protein n=1 Tax=Streptomyces sp. F001 TaxID=1510026 RepID=UPI0013EE7FA9|nr:discoidin domain-containing protein [Streptomyces sp. F001]